MGNLYENTGQLMKQTFSTRDESLHVEHKEVDLKDPTPLGRNGDHGVV